MDVNRYKSIKMCYNSEVFKEKKPKRIQIINGYA